MTPVTLADGTVVDDGTGDDGGPRVVPIGSLKTLGGLVYQWNGREWYNTGVRDERADTGNTFEQDYALATAPRSSSSFSSSVSSRDPGQFAQEMGLELAKLGLSRDQLAQAAAQFNATLGLKSNEFFEGIRQFDAKLAAEVQSAASQRQFQAAEAERTRDFQREGQATEFEFRAGESAADRAQRAAEFATERAAREAEFGATFGLQNKRLGFDVDLANRQGEMAAGDRRLAAARQYADLVSSTDTAALPAYLMAGGGALVNARAANPAGLLTDNAVLPAARSLQEAETARWNPIQYTPAQYTPGAPFQYNPPPAFQYRGLLRPEVRKPVEIRPGYPGGAFQDNGTFTYKGPDGPAAIGPAAGGFAPAPTSATQPVFADVGGGSVGMGAGGESPLTRPGTPDFVRFAAGTDGFIPAPPTFITGDSPSGMPTGWEERVHVADPPGPDNAMLKVEPSANTRRGLTAPGYAMGTGEGGMQQIMGGMAAMMTGMQEMMGRDEAMPPPAMPMPQEEPRFALGTTSDPAGLQDAMSPIDAGYVERVRQFRRGLQPLNVGFNPYQPQFTRQVSPLLQNAYYQREQTRTGIPAEQQAFDAARFRPRGFQREAVRIGY